LLHPIRGRLIGKDSDAGRDWGQEEKGMTEDEMGKEMGGRFKTGGIYVYLWLIHVEV